jgi:DNA repair protein RecO (recombination protein O)
MSAFNTPAIVLRRVDYGDFDVIVTFFSLRQGKLAAIAKAAKKSTRRFAGMLELFAALDIVCQPGRGKGLPVLQEVAIVRPYERIRADVHKTAYASYWAEMVNAWMEPGHSEPRLFRLLGHALRELDEGPRDTAAGVSVFFQAQFLFLCGLSPALTHCIGCRRELDRIGDPRFAFDLSRGGLLCRRCRAGPGESLPLSKATAKQLLWLQTDDLRKACKLRFTAAAVAEGQALLEAFVPYHLGRMPKSMRVLQQVRRLSADGAKPRPR